MSSEEMTFVAIKPDGVQRNLVHEIIKRFEVKGFKLCALKMVHASEKLMKEHYKEHEGKAFLPPLIKFMTSGPIVAMIWSGRDVIATTRQMIGATDPAKAAMGTIRGDLGITVGRNVVHASDGPEGSKREIGLWFKQDEIMQWTKTDHQWLYE